MDKSELYYKYSRQEMLPFIPTNAHKVLEIGCGEGVFLKSIANRQTIEPWGIEPFQQIPAETKSFFYRLFNTSVEECIDSLPNNYFDCIILNDVIEHLVDPWEMLKVLKTKLNANGKVVASIPNVRFLPHIYHMLVQKNWEYTPLGGIRDITHLRFFTKKSMLQFFNQCGFKVEQIEGVNPIELFRYKLMISLSMGFLSDTRCEQFACVATIA